MNVIALSTLGTSQFKRDAHVHYGRWRESQPVLRLRNRSQAVWLLTRYDDVLSMLKDNKLVKNRHGVLSAGQAKKQSSMPGFLAAMERNMLDVDAPDHTRLRQLVHLAFTPKRVDQMRGRIRELCETLCHRIQGQTAFDCIREYALPIPLTVISEILGLSLNDRREFHRCIGAALNANSPLKMLLVLPHLYRFSRLMKRIIAQKRSCPEDDLISALLQAHVEHDRLTEDELSAMVFLLATAGYETTVNLIGNGVLALLQHPDQLEQLKAHPQCMESAIEEMLRFYSPVEISTERYAVEDFECSGMHVRRGDMVLGALASANRDEARFERPLSFDVMRNPNRHLAFGQGIHFCLGAPLARLEGRIAFEVFLPLLDRLKLDVSTGALKWKTNVHLRGLEQLPLRR